MSRSTQYRPLARAKLFAAAVLVLAASLVGVAVDAVARRTAQAETRALSRAVVRALGTPDLALSSSSRWLRHPSQTEPGAPFSDSPASLDTDPGGAVIGPPRELLGAGARDALVRRGRGAP